MGVPSKFLGMELQRMTGDLFGFVMKQEMYAKILILRFMPVCNAVNTPMAPGTVLTNEGESLPDSVFLEIYGSSSLGDRPA
jgi:hypothetical protein